MRSEYEGKFMKVTPQFVKFYNETFKFIEKELGTMELEEYFRKVGPFILADLSEKVCDYGLKGALKYWQQTLNEEGAHWQTELEESGEPPKAVALTLRITKCPSREALGDKAHSSYCRHCDVMYRGLFEAYGYKYSIEKTGDASCTIKVTR